MQETTTKKRPKIGEFIAGHADLTTDLLHEDHY
jgi:hypothetical protein